ncbi:hypothetical protein [Curtobacterium sp. 9128]|uniref:hypothetical protein n=1 Tax=Curtobacterium sp. 9128 TaxID=1793722 RepID=UPI0011A02BD4|nr:hypothetical protein [Curtobacterium sp. 9128]
MSVSAPQKSTRRRVAAVAAVGAVALLLSGCSSSGVSAAAPATPTASARTVALQPGDADTGTHAVCGHVSAYLTITTNAQAGLAAGDIDATQEQTLFSAARYGYERLPSEGPLSAGVTAVQKWLAAHPETPGSLAIDLDDAGWGDAFQTLTTACAANGSPLGVDARYGG